MSITLRPRHLALACLAIMAVASCTPVPDPEVTLPRGYDPMVTKTETTTYAPDRHADIYTPAWPPTMVIVYFHAGGFFRGDRSDVLPMVLRQVHRGAIVVSVDYRLGPEHPYPAAANDARLAVEWARNRWDLPLIAWGHSAGAYLAARTAVNYAHVPWVGVSGVYHFPTLGARGFPWSHWARTMTDAWFDEPEPERLTLEFTPHSKPAYVIHGDGDTVVHSDQALYVAVSSEATGFPAHYDYVDTGPAACRNHLVDCGYNVLALDTWLDALAVG